VEPVVTENHSIVQVKSTKRISLHQIPPVDTVLVAGKTLKQGGRLLHIDLEQIRAQTTASRDYLMEASGFSKTFNVLSDLLLQPDINS